MGQYIGMLTAGDKEIDTPVVPGQIVITDRYSESTARAGEGVMGRGRINKTFLDRIKELATAQLMELILLTSVYNWYFYYNSYKAYP